MDPITQEKIINPYDIIINNVKTTYDIETLLKWVIKEKKSTNPLTNTILPENTIEDLKLKSKKYLLNISIYNNFNISIYNFFNIESIYIKVGNLLGLNFESFADYYDNLSFDLLFKGGTLSKYFSNDIKDILEDGSIISLTLDPPNFTYLEKRYKELNIPRNNNYTIYLPRIINIKNLEVNIIKLYTSLKPRMGYRKVELKNIIRELNSLLGRKYNITANKTELVKIIFDIIISYKN